MNELTIVKFGSELVTREQGVNQAALNLYATVLAEEYRDQGLVVVTSGAVKAGRLRVEQSGGDANEYADPTLSQLGSAAVMSAWELAFQRQKRLAGGLLITHNELDDAKEGALFREALQLALKSSVVTILNENDALSRTELMALANASDNDGLASHVARMLGANRLRIFTSNGGIIDDDKNLISTVDHSNVEGIRAMLEQRLTEKKPKGNQRGGILAKFNAAKLAAELGIKVTIERFSTDESKRKTTQFMLG